MNYIPLYRKYRPQKLEEVVGQEHIKKALRNAIELNKISHAYLFTGPRGTGKTSTARIFAKSLNCKEGPTISPCGKCSNCIDITNSTPMDVIEIDAASNRKVEDAQNILERVMYAPVNSRYKIYIIDEVHMLSTTAFNALLKTLEEPPENVIFILATTEVHKVLDTIKSRCQRFDFKRITTDDIVKHLKYISEQEKINITDDALLTIAKNSAGGMRDSIALLDQLSVLDGKEAISTDDINNLLGRLSFDTLNNLAENIVNSNPQNAIVVLENIYNSGNEPVQILTNLMDYIKNLLIVKTCKKEIAFELTQANDVQISALTKQSENVETHQLVALIDKCSEYIKELKLTNNPRLWLEVAIIDLANLTENTKLAELQNRLARLEGGVVEPVKISAYKTAPAPVTKPEVLNSGKLKVESGKLDNSQLDNSYTSSPLVLQSSGNDFSPMPKSQPVEGADLSTLWGQLLTLLQSAPTRALLKQWANPVKISADETIISMKSEIFMKQVQSGAKYDAIIEAVDSLFGQKNSNVVIRLPQAGDETIKQPVVQTPAPQVQPKKKPEPEPTPDAEEIRELKEEVQQEKEQLQKDAETLASNMHSDNVNMVMQLFDGKIID
ncbi:DNA polymerase III subunit gamma/tau [bacterium]|nr:DNA polymerase III subunit gamma/tau [bacterium]